MWLPYCRINGPFTGLACFQFAGLACFQFAGLACFQFACPVCLLLVTAGYPDACHPGRAAVAGSTTSRLDEYEKNQPPRWGDG